MRLLVVEDKLKVATLIADVLGDVGYTVDIEYTGDAGLESMTRNAYDLVILDHLLPGISGRDVCKRARAVGITTPVLMVTARDAVSDRVAGLDAGADDYLTKPFSIEELVARVRALLRRQALASAKLRCVEDLVLDTASRTVTRDGSLIDLSAKEYDLLDFLMQHSGRVVAKSQIAAEVWGYDFDTSLNIVEVYISYLRSKVDGRSEKKLIKTVRGAGYQIG